VSGVGVRIALTFEWVEGVAVDAVTGSAYVTTVNVINHDTPNFGRIMKGINGTWSILSPEQKLSGLIAVVPPQFAAAGGSRRRGAAWKAMMR